MLVHMNGAPGDVRQQNAAETVPDEDERQFSRTGEIFTADARYDVTDFGKGVCHGPGRSPRNGAARGRVIRWPITPST